MPDLALQYARLLRDVKVQETLYGLLVQQYEMARIQEAKDSPTVQILDIAKVPGKKSKPKRLSIVLFSTFAAAVFSMLIVFIMEMVENEKQALRRTKNGNGDPGGVFLEIEKGIESLAVPRGEDR
ncbi:MAG: hypothetical protein MPW14_00020 [Candidatus Manganitrophus sp.]|nr:MAG: hypothetical protein MPW14_00020 [Candidatus Manganitrophus sp.]